MVQCSNWILIKHTWPITQYVKLSEQFTAFKYPVNMLPKVQDVLDASGRGGGRARVHAVTWYSCKTNIFLFRFCSYFSKGAGRKTVNVKSVVFPSQPPRPPGTHFPFNSLRLPQPFKFTILHLHTVLDNQHLRLLAWHIHCLHLVNKIT